MILNSSLHKKSDIKPLKVTVYYYYYKSLFLLIFAHLKQSFNGNN